MVRKKASPNYAAVALKSNELSTYMLNVYVIHKSERIVSHFFDEKKNQRNRRSERGKQRERER